MIFLGVDGGGTKTEFVAINEAGREIARALTGTTYHLQVGLEEALARLSAGVSDVCDRLSVRPSDLRYAFFGLPAYGEDAAVDPLLAAGCGAILGHGRYRCDNDIVCGWAGSLACEDGINLVAGTGSIAYGQRHGHGARVGGWGELFSDEGSAYWIATQGLNLFSRMSDGRLPSGALRTAFANALSLAADIDICARTMGPTGMTRDEIAGLAPIVSQAAAAGDEEAAAILDCAGLELARMAEALRSRLGFDVADSVPLSWSGGVLTRQAEVRAALLRHLDGMAPFEIVHPRHTPGHGAALYAAMLAGAAV